MKHVKKIINIIFGIIKGLILVMLCMGYGALMAITMLMFIPVTALFTSLIGGRPYDEEVIDYYERVFDLVKDIL